MGDIPEIIGLNIGAGHAFKEKKWENLDYIGNKYCKNDYIPHINLDLNSLKKINRDNKTYDCIYSSHTIEHLLNEPVANIFSESFRLLKDNGIIRISCPDYDKMFNAGMNNISVSPGIGIRKFKERWNAFDAFLYKSFTFCHRRGREFDKNGEFNDEIVTKKKFFDLLKEGGKEHAFNYCYNICKKYNLKYADVYSGYHINWWNEEKLTKYLKQAGFSDIKVYPRNGLSYTNSMIGPNFGDSMPGWSIFIEAKKQLQ
jgi:predicted SAM-dependent methyltransferase